MNSASEIQLIIAHGDDEIQDAIKGQNLSLYLKLLEDKNILQSSIIKCINDYNSSNHDIINTKGEAPVFAIVPVAVYAVAAAAAAIVVEVALFVHFANWFAGASASTQESIIKEDPAIKLFLKGNQDILSVNITDYNNIKNEK